MRWIWKWGPRHGASVFIFGLTNFSMSLAISRSLMKFFGIVTDRLSLAVVPAAATGTLVAGGVVVCSVGALDTSTFVSGVNRSVSGITGCARASPPPTPPERSSSHLFWVGGCSEQLDPVSSGSSCLIFFDAGSRQSSSPGAPRVQRPLLLCVAVERSSRLPFCLKDRWVDRPDRWRPLDRKLGKRSKTGEQLLRPRRPKSGVGERDPRDDGEDGGLSKPSNLFQSSMFS